MVICTYIAESIGLTCELGSKVLENVEIMFLLHFSPFIYTNCLVVTHKPLKNQPRTNTRNPPQNLFL